MCSDGYYWLPVLPSSLSSMLRDSRISQAKGSSHPNLYPYIKTAAEAAEK